MPINRSNVTEDREDFSRFVVHLTSEKQGDEVGTAPKNLLSILRARKIEARNPHCLHKLDGLAEEIRCQFNVVCLTEVPLQQIHLLTQEIEGRKVMFKPYGIVFRKNFLIRKGAQPAIYINSYNHQTFHREAADELFKHCREQGFKSKMHRLLPLLNAMHEKYDFTWEREWRVVGDLHFDIKDIVCLILPQEGAEHFKRSAARNCIPFISPGWTYERIVSEVALQQKRTGNHYEEMVDQLEAEKEAREDAKRRDLDEAKAEDAQVDAMECK